MVILVILIIAAVIYTRFNQGKTASRPRRATRAGSVCGRCDGSGRYGWNRRAGGMCFGCRGTGRATRRTLARA